MAKNIVALVLSAPARSIALTAAMALSTGAPPSAKAAEAKPSSTPRVDYPKHAPRLVEQALAASLAGNVDERATLLKRAAAADADYAPARWQQGQLKFDGQWRTPAQVAEHVNADERWQEYQSLRAVAGQSPVDHQQLARWCMRNQLSAEERYHWANVILADPNHDQARQRLGLLEFQGGLYTREQVAAEKARREQAERDLARFKPKFLELCRDATSDLKSVRERALADLRDTDDPAAIPGLREAVRRTLETSAGKAHRSELVLGMTAALANMPQHVATLNLLELAVSSTLAEVRQAAAEALRPRPATDYVPLLMAALQAPIEAEIDVIAAPDGTVRMVETLIQQQPLRKIAEKRSTNFEVAGAFGRNKAKTDMGAVLNRHLATASSRADVTQSRVEIANAAAQERNERIQAVLKITLGAEATPADVTAWWEAWKDYNELQYDASVTDYESNVNDTYVYAYEQAPRMAAARAGEGAGGQRPQGEPRAAARRTHECFAAGTLVWLQSGPTPIERVRVGDLVLAQQPTTGELAYRPVLETTVSAAAPVVRVKLPQEEFVATRGHRFWVEGAGWLMAKELPAAATLHALNGGLSVVAVEPTDEVDCYNLIVDEFHTFVVGKSQLLVHDKTCPQPTIAVTPGLADPKLKLKNDVIRSTTELLSSAVK